MDFTIEYKRGSNTRVLSIEVDGEQHFKGGYHGTSSLAQREIDQKKDELALAQNRHLLRLHYQDQSYWKREIKHAQRELERTNHRSNVFYSWSYNKENRFKNIRRR